MRTRQKEVFFTLPNILTLSRIALIPILIAMMLQHRALESLLVFLLAGLTDVLDGFAARTWHQRTRTGILLDPAADKLLLTSSFILLTLPSLSYPYAIPIWLTATVILRDFVIAAGALVIYRVKGQKNFLPSLFGKASTVAQVGTVFLVLLANYIQRAPFQNQAFLSFLSSGPFLQAVFYLTLLATLLSWIHYGWIGISMMRSPKKT